MNETYERGLIADCESRAAPTGVVRLAERAAFKAAVVELVAGNSTT